MTNRKLKHKIRQAFEHATPDHAESVSLDSLLSDTPLKKGEEKKVKADKQEKTTIQFRVIATLAASIAVVALLAGLIPNSNPFLPSNEQVYGSGPDDTTPPAVSGFDLDNLEVLDWHQLYLQYFYQHHNDDYVYYHEIVQYNGRTCLVMAADYGSYGKYVLVDAATGQTEAETDILGSNHALELYDIKTNSEIDLNAVTCNLEFYKDTICYRFELVGTAIRGLCMNAQNGQVLESYVFDVISPDSDTTDDPLEVPAYPSYISQEFAIDAALTHAGLLKEELLNGTVTCIPTSNENILTVSFSTADYEYEYDFLRMDGSILYASKEYRHELSPTSSSTSIIDRNEAVQIVFDDPMINELASVQKVEKIFDDGVALYHVYLNQVDLQYEIDVSCEAGMIVEIIINRLLYGDASSVEITTTPPDGKISKQEAIETALRLTGITANDIGTKLINCEEDTDELDEQAHYDINFIYQNYEYTYEIGMYSAQVLSIEKEKLD